MKISDFLPAMLRSKNGEGRPGVSYRGARREMAKKIYRARKKSRRA